MHGTVQTTPDTSTSEKKLVVDPVCRMTIDPATAAAREVFDGKPVYFCSEGCRRRFRQAPTMPLMRRRLPPRRRAATINVVRSRAGMICND